MNTAFKVKKITKFKTTFLGLYSTFTLLACPLRSQVRTKAVTHTMLYGTSGNRPNRIHMRD